MLVTVTGRAIWQNLPAHAKLNPTRPLELNRDDVMKAWPSRFPFPEHSRRLLTNARITVRPDPGHPGGFYCKEEPGGYGMSSWCSYEATIQLADGTKITTTYAPEMNGKGRMRGPDVRVRWPGATHDGPLWDR